MKLMGAHRRGEGEEGQGARPRGCCRGGVPWGAWGEGKAWALLVSLLCCSLPEAAVHEEGSTNQGGRRRKEKKKRKKYEKISKK
jgi:hypothetical protein